MRKLLKTKHQIFCQIDDDDFTSYDRKCKGTLLLRIKKWLNEFTMPFPFSFLNSFKWFRRLCGGTWFYLRFTTEYVTTFKCWSRWEGGFRATALKTETYSLSQFQPRYLFKWLTNKRWFREYCGGIWYYNRYWWDAGASCMFCWERKQLPSLGGSACNIKEENY